RSMTTTASTRDPKDSNAARNSASLVDHGRPPTNSLGRDTALSLLNTQTLETRYRPYLSLPEPSTGSKLCLFRDFVERAACQNRPKGITLFREVVYQDVRSFRAGLRPPPPRDAWVPLPLPSSSAWGPLPRDVRLLAAATEVAQARSAEHTPID